MIAEGRRTVPNRQDRCYARFMSGFYSPWHLAIFFLIVLLLFGTKRLPEMGRSLGKGMREFKESVTGHDVDDDDDMVAHRELPATPVSEEPVPTPSREHDTV